MADIENIRKNVKTFVDMSVMHGDEKKRCSFLHGLLASLLRGRPLQLVKEVEKANGLQQLIVACALASRNRSMGLLSCILSWPYLSSKSTYLAQILKFETAVTWLQLRITDSTSYSELRESILATDERGGRNDAWW